MKKDLESSDEQVFFDTTVFVYAFTEPDTAKGREAQKLLMHVFEGKKKGSLSNQVLAELGSVLLSKYHSSPADVDIVVESILSNKNWSKLNYTGVTVARCVKAINHYKTRFFDTLIAETMKENEISKIITENVKDFDKIEGIEAINPF